MRKRLVFLSSIFPIFLVVGFGAAYLQTICTERRAEGLLNDVRGLVTGVSNFEDVQHLTRKFPDYLKPSSQSCSQDSCEISFNFDNRWLSISRFAPYTSFAVGISVKSDRVKYMSLVMSTDSVGGVRAWVEQFAPETPMKAYQVGGKRDSAPPWHSFLITVRFTPNADTARKEDALAFNLNCFTTFLGCKYSEQMLPRVRVTQEQGQPNPGNRKSEEAKAGDAWSLRRMLWATRLSISTTASISSPRSLTLREITRNSPMTAMATSSA